MDDLNQIGMIDFPEFGSFQYENFNYETQSIEFKPIETEILNNLNREDILEKVSRFEFSKNVREFIGEYEKIFSKRDKFIWKWLGVIFKETGVTLSTVDENLFDSLIEDKIILSMIDCIIDDTAEYHKDAELLNEMFVILDDRDTSRNIGKNEKLIFLKKLWDFLILKLSNYPRFEEFIDIFMYDFQQLINCVRFSTVVNNNLEILNLIEMETYDCHNMIVFLLNDIGKAPIPNLFLLESLLS